MFDRDLQFWNVKRRVMMKIILSIVSCLIFFGCSNSDLKSHAEAQKKWMQPNGKIKILSTTAMIDDLAKNIGGDQVETFVLIKGDLDPHSYQLVKGDDEKLAFADLIFYNGLGLEHGPSLQNYLANNKKAVALGNKLVSQQPDLALYYKGQLDPHIWMDISLWVQVVPYIEEALISKFPLQAEFFRANAKKLTKELLRIHQDVLATLQTIPSAKRYLVTSHDAFNYFSRAYLADHGEAREQWQERFAAPEGLAPESQISAAEIQDIIDHLGKYHIHVLFPESNINRDSIRKIVKAAQEKQISVKIADIPLYADAMGKPGSDGDTYSKMMLHNAKNIAAYLHHNGE